MFRRMLSILCLLAGLSLVTPVHAEEPETSLSHWPQPAGPHGNWTVPGEPPLRWSVTRRENIRWTTPMPEAGMSNVTIWGDRLFVTTHVPIQTEAEKEGVKDIIGYCLDAENGSILWQVTLPGSVFISLAGGFTDGTVFGPITDGSYVWFFNRCGSIGCYDMEGQQVWLREWTPRFKHNNRQCEPILVGDSILYVEAANKERAAQLRKWSAPGVKAPEIEMPEGADERELWTYIHALDKNTGEVLWREDVGSSVHTTPVVGKMQNGDLAIAHARGGGHGPLEKPYGHSLTSLAPDRLGETLWSTEVAKYSPAFSCHWNARYTLGFLHDQHLVFDTNTGELLRQQELSEGATLWKLVPHTGDWVRRDNVTVPAGKQQMHTNQANILVGDWHWFLCHRQHYLGRVHIETGQVEYLELPAQLNAGAESRKQDVWHFSQPLRGNRPLNAQGFAVGDKGHNGSGWGHISAASPILVGHYLLIPVVTGTVYVVDTSTEALTPDSLVAINDLGPATKTWCLASLSYAHGRLYAHTMRSIICIEP